jgi:hypothetical protein
MPRALDAPVLSREQMLAGAQVIESELIVESVHPHAGPMRADASASVFRRDACGDSPRRFSESIPTRCPPRWDYRQIRLLNSAPCWSSRDPKPPGHVAFSEPARAEPARACHRTGELRYRSRLLTR